MELSRPITAYLRPKTLLELENALSPLPTGARLIAGGTDLMVKLGFHQKAAEPVVLISMGGIDELAGIFQEKNGWIGIGSMTTLSDLGSSPSLSGYTALREAAHSVAGPSIRNTATVGGNVCNASPSADLSVALLASDAEVSLHDAKGNERRMPVAAFFIGPGKTALLPGEYLRTFHLPPVTTGTFSSFHKLGVRAVMEIAIVNVALRIELGTDGKCKAARIALGAVAPVVIRALDAEDALVGVSVNGKSWADAIASAATLAMEAAKPISDVRASAGYRRDMIRALVAEGLTSLGRKATGSPSGTIASETI
jgi:carbon-monoxide dehydrogenase medium subunit